MFFREFKYMLLSSLRSRELIFWTLLFPFALTTFMYMAFGDIFDRTEKFEPVPVAIVKEQDNMTLTAMLNAVSAEGDKKLLITTYTGEKEAKKLLEEDQVKGIIYMGNKLSLTVKESGMDETMLQSVLKQFTKYESLIQDTAQKHPDKIEQAVKPMQQEISYFTKEENTRGNQDNVVNYFYAIFAMTCLFASFSGCVAILQMQANLTPLGQRRNVCGMKKSTMFVADFAATELVQFVLACALLIYMRFVLNLQIGERYAAIVLLLFVGTSFGIVFGMLIGSIAHLSQGGKIGVLVSSNLVLCAMSDLNTFLYKSDRNFGWIFASASLIAIFVACLGLWIVTLFSTLSRLKEVGIRKVLGANKSSLFFILTKELMLLTILASAIGIPVSAVLMNGWLETYAFHISLPWWIYAVVFALLMLIAFLTVFQQVWRIICLKPMSILKYE